MDNHSTFIWSIADLLRGDYKPSEYSQVILPLTVLRRMDCVLEPTKPAVLAAAREFAEDTEPPELVLRAAAGHRFYNTSQFDLKSLLTDDLNLRSNLLDYLRKFSPSARNMFEKFKFEKEVAKLASRDLLHQVLTRFVEIDLHPDVVSNIEMGYIYEELLRKFSELENEEAGRHFTPREVIRLMTTLLLQGDEQSLARPGAVRTLFDPACGTGGMLSTSEEYVRQHFPTAALEVFGQELNDETYAICAADMMIQNLDSDHIAYGNSLSEDAFPGQSFDYLLANPPFGDDWKKVRSFVTSEHKTMGFTGRFGAGLPRVNDSSFLFLQHMISKMKSSEEGGSRLAIVFNGSPLFTGGAGSGESEIRRWIIENDWLEAVVALPDQLFYNTNISIYIWIVTNRKTAARRGKVRLIDAREHFVKMRKSLGQKRKEISEEQINDIVYMYSEDAEGENVKVLANESFGFQRITVERPLRQRWEVTGDVISDLRQTKQWNRLDGEAQRHVEDQLRRNLGRKTTNPKEMSDWLTLQPEGEDAAKLYEVRDGALVRSHKALPALIEKPLWKLLAKTDPEAPIVTDRKGRPEPDPDLRDYENVPLPQPPVAWEPDPSARLASPEYRAAVDEYMAAEVLPYVPDAWVDHSKTKIGYEIPLTRHFYKYVPPRPLPEIDAEIKQLETEIQDLLREVTGR